MKENRNEKLWTSSFAILWQGQFVSTVGDAVYSIALGFWILAATGSTTLMGALMAASTLPGVLVAPFAGVIIDTVNKKRLFILLDLARGACVVFIGISAYQDKLAIWMVFAAGVLLSLCGAIFNPGVQSTIPDIVPKSRLSNAISLFSVLASASNMIGNIAGGFLFQIIGAPVLFLFNGISFLFSGSSIFFTKIPDAPKKEKIHFFEDMAEGFRYMWNQKGLRVILMLAAMCNFCSYIAIVLFLPFCKYTPGLGSGSYGILMAVFMAGAVAGFLVMSVKTPKAKNKLKIFISANAAFNICMITAFNQPSFLAMAVLLLLSGFFNSLFNVLLISTIQASSKSEVRGKVMSFLNMITQGLTPFAMALGGVLGDHFPLRSIITGAIAAMFVFSVPAYINRSFKDFITTDFSEAALDEPMPQTGMESEICQAEPGFDESRGSL